MRHDQRQRLLVPRLHVDEVDVHAVDLGHELGQRVQPRLAPTPVVIGHPVLRQRPNRRQLHPLRAIRDGSLVGHRTAAMRRRRSSKASFGNSTWNERIAVAPRCSVVADMSVSSVRDAAKPPCLPNASHQGSPSRFHAGPPRSRGTFASPARFNAVARDHRLAARICFRLPALTQRINPRFRSTRRVRRSGHPCSCSLSASTRATSSTPRGHRMAPAITKYRHAGAVSR